MNVYFHTFGCKANQYDTEKMRQELAARGAGSVERWTDADVCVLNTCTVTNRADAEARRVARRIKRENPEATVVVAGCSAALRGSDYREMPEVRAVVPGQDPVAVAVEVERTAARNGGLVQLGLDRALDRIHEEPVGAEILERREGGTRGWLKIQDGCDRKCSFCATRLARGASRSRLPRDVVREARTLARHHPELVLTGIHIGHYGRDLEPDGETTLRGDRPTLAGLVRLLLDAVPDVRIRLGSVEATEVDDPLVELMAGSGGRVAPHLHMPLQSGADPVLRRMRRWHTRESYRARALEIVERMGDMALGADIITGFPGETDEDHRATVALVEELPYTYVHTFPFSPRDGTAAADLQEEMPVPQRVAGERSREIREIVRAKGAAYAHRRAEEGGRARVVLEGRGGRALTGDYLRVPVRDSGRRDPHRLHEGILGLEGGEVVVTL